MTKREFFAVLQRELYNLPQNELKEQLSFYNEMIDDGMEEGLSEEAAVAKIGSISEILSQMRSERFELSVRADAPRKEVRRLGVWAIILIVLGSPIWLSIAAALFSVIVAFYAVIWSVFAAVCAVEVSFAAVGAAGVLYPFIFIPQGDFLQSAFVFGAALVCAGLSVFLWYGCKAMLFGILKLTKRSFEKTLTLFKKRRY
ncbi:MAG: DUF1700 domain-containing protein [Ruminococcaceae bacterium]|nr:DUF1700 domain-containing protein [Oscillospiraceae bacterium]